MCLLYTSDIPESDNSTIETFADYIAIMAVGNTYEDVKRVRMSINVVYFGIWHLYFILKYPCMVYMNEMLCYDSRARRKASAWKHCGELQAGPAPPSGATPSDAAPRSTTPSEPRPSTSCCTSRSPRYVTRRAVSLQLTASPA